MTPAMNPPDDPFLFVSQRDYETLRDLDMLTDNIRAYSFPPSILQIPRRYSTTLPFRLVDANLAALLDVFQPRLQAPPTTHERDGYSGSPLPAGISFASDLRLRGRS